MATTTSSRTPPLSPRRTNNTQQTNNSTATRSSRSSSKQSISQRRTSSPPPMSMSMSSSLSSLPSPQSSPSGRPSTSSSISSGRRQQQTSSPAPPLSPPVTTKKGVLKRSSLASSSSSCRTPQSSPVSPSPSSLAAPMISSNGNNHKMSGRRRRVAISPPPEEDSRRRRQQQQQQTAMVEKEDDSATESTLEESNDLSLIAGTTTTSTAIISATARTTTTTTTMSTTGSKIRPPIGNASSPTVVSRAAAVALSTTTTPTAATPPTKQNHSSPPPRIYYEVTEFHQCIVAKDWPQLEKALHKYNDRYYKRKREQAQRRKEKQQLLLQQQQQQQQQEAQQQQQDSHSSLGDGSGSGPKSPGSLDVSLFMIRTPSASSSTTNNNRNSTRRALNVLKLLPQTMSFLSPRSGSHRPDDEAEGDHEEDEKMISPLLKVDENGRTPLHLALLYEGCPEAIVLDLLRKDRLAATQPDHAGQLALHVAMTHRQHYRVLDKLINAYPNAMKQKDLQGRTPIGYAIELTREAQEEKEKEAVLAAARAAGAENDDDLSSFSPAHSLRSPPFYHWATPRTPAEKAWQFDQMAIWSAVEFILRDLMRRKKSVIPSEHILLVDALEGGAPPKVIHRLISTTDKYLLGDDDFAGSALALCIDRQYPLDTIEYLVDYFGHGDGSTILSDYTQKALTTHYRLGCQSLTLGMPAFGNEIIDWNKKMHRSNNNNDSTSTSIRSSSSNNNNKSTDDAEKKEEEPQQQQLQEGSTNNQEFLSGASAQCREWWSILKYLLLFSAYGKKKVEASNSNNKDIPNDGILRDMHLVHAALAIPATQPSLVQLLLVLFPEARNELCPTYKALPIHLACTRWHYDVLRNDKDKSMEKVLKTMFLKADKEQVLYRHSGRLPLHMALTVGQSWGFVKPFVSMEKKSVGMRDPHTKLFPFQLAAMKISSKNLAMLLRHQYTPSEWRTTPPSEKKVEFARARDTQDRRQIGTIYELLRRHPDAIAGKYLVRDSFKVTGLVRGAGPISSHYLSWAYHRGTNGWRLNPTNVKPLRDSIVNGYIAKPLAGWWDQLRKLIWEKTPSDAMPEKTDGFLLHAALYNSDTPPTIIELLLALFPMAATQPIPGTRIYPLHIAAGTAVYQPQTFEVPYAMDNMQLTLNAYKGAVRLTVNGQLPIHICLSRGKTWKEVRPLVKRDPKMLLVEDGISKLVPFQLMATFRITSANNILRFAAIAEKQTRSIEMEDLSVVERAKTLRDVKRNFDLHVLSTIYEILRRAPSAMIRHIACSSGSTVCDVVSTVSSVTNDDIDFDSNKSAASPGGKNNMAILDQYLKTVQETPVPGPKKSLSSYLDLRGAPGGGGRSLISSPSALETSMAGRGLSNILAGGGERNPRGGGMPDREASQRSLTISRSNGALYEDYAKPVYDDADVMSNSMGGASMNSSGGAFTSSPMPRHSPSTSTATTPGSSVRRSARRGTKKDRNNHRLPINLPDLHLDD